MIPGGFGRRSQQRALRNARAAALEVRRRRIEQEEVERFLNEKDQYDPTPPERRRTHREPREK